MFTTIFFVSSIFFCAQEWVSREFMTQPVDGCAMNLMVEILMAKASKSFLRIVPRAASSRVGYRCILALPKGLFLMFLTFNNHVGKNNLRKIQAEIGSGKLKELSSGVDELSSVDDFHLSLEEEDSSSTAPQVVVTRANTRKRKAEKEDAKSLQDLQVRIEPVTDSSPP